MSDVENPIQEGTDPKVVSLVSYLTLIGWIVALILNRPKSELGSFHLRQALGIILLFMASSFIFIIPILGWIAGFVGYILGVVLWILGFIGAIKAEMKPVPVLGKQFQEWFKSL